MRPEPDLSLTLLRNTRLVVVVGALFALAPWARADSDRAAADSAYLIGEFVDPVCIYQHGMQGVAQRACALVDGRVEQGMFFLDIRKRHLYTVIGVTHWEDPRKEFLARLGDTVAVRGKVWRRAGSSAIAIAAVHPWREQPRPAYAFWPWHWEWSVLLGCGLIATAYLLALTRLRARLGGPPGFERGHAAVFLLGLVVVALSLNGPMHDLSDLYLFSSHMVQHLLLAQVFPPLLILGVPEWLKARLLEPRWIDVPWGALTRVPVGFILYTAVFSLWHVPSFYDLMMREHGIHVVMHLMVMGTAILMWWPIAGGEAVKPPLQPPAQLLYLFLLGIPMMGLAALITFANRPLYAWYALAPRFAGLSAVDDQRLGGLIMWVPGTLFWWGIMSIVFFRWAARDSRPDDPLPRDADGLAPGGRPHEAPGNAVRFASEDPKMG